MIPTWVRMDVIAILAWLGRRLVELREDFLGQMEGVIGCRHTAVNRRLQQHFLDLIAGDTVVECGADVQPEFVRPVQRHHHRHRDQAAGVPRQARAGPYLAPGIARDQFLEFLVEGVAAGQRPIDMGVTEHRPTHLQSIRVPLALFHGPTPQRSRNASTSAVKRLAASTFEICAASSSMDFAPGMTSAMRLPSAGGVDASWAPVTISVGRSIRDRVAHWSMSRTAAHEATYPSAGLAMSMARIRRMVSAAASRNRGVNQTSISASAMPLTPPLLTASMRAFHRSAEPIRGAVVA